MKSLLYLHFCCGGEGIRERCKEQLPQPTAEFRQVCTLTGRCQQHLSYHLLYMSLIRRLSGLMRGKVNAERVCIVVAIHDDSLLLYSRDPWLRKRDNHRT